MNIITWFYFPARLAWRQLIDDRAKLIAAICGVLFACVLVFMQLGFKDSLYASAASAPLKLDGDLFLMHKQSEAMWRSTHFERNELMRALGHPAVAEVAPLYLALASFKNIKTKVKRTLMVYGFDPDVQLFDITAVKNKRRELRQKDTVLFDEASRPEFGQMPQLLATGRNTTEINDYTVTILDLFRLGVSFAADGNVVTSDLNFMRIFPDRNRNGIDLGVIRLYPGAAIEQVQADLASQLNEFVNIFTYEELLQYEKRYWENTAPIGFIFGFGTVMGLVVGLVIVYQILFTDIANHRYEFATLKAMGYQHDYFIRVVFASAFFLALLGFIPGYILSIGLYHLAESQIFMPMPMSLSKAVTVFFFILFMCAMAGFLAIHKLKSANPADMF
ncbi:putative ABC transport system permease protein [Nitrosomonas cryotolerans]|uniref:Putative ABC transport system permease protein n=1 Tax=Nitrosomonas cryotolerans ATCC 49181 TaxID=1131553 RepID=A0A1N6IXJ5_9PROT|nr:ABC transporter permease DevC [Nitrosomonas cryotolerans]SFP85981.1 putative ABC transport system permease protein [Nitrosomonas cryotolerans]SIO36733.1 putative ABC transport system permease protein [Nitrosomonas cryotolerans ATCC 49181]